MKMELYNMILITQRFELYILFFDETKGHVPIFIYPKESIKFYPDKMRPIKVHPIWFLDIKEKSVSDHIDLAYEGKVYYAKKFQIISKRKKRRAGLEKDTHETIVIVIALPTDIYLYGVEFLDVIAENIIANFKNILYQIIEIEIVRDEIIKTTKINEIIKKGDTLKKELRDFIRKTCKKYLSKIIIYNDNYL